MTLREFAIGLAVTALTFFVGAGVALRAFDIDVHVSLLIGLATWIVAGYAFMREMKS